MINKSEFVTYLKSLNADDAKVAFTLNLAEEFELFSNSIGASLPELEKIKTFCKKSIAGKSDALSRIGALARFCRFSGLEEAMIYLLSMGNTLGVMKSMQERLKKIAGNDAADTVFADLKEPPLGSLQEDYPEFIGKYMQNLQDQLPLCTCQKVLAGNHHGLPVEAFAEDKLKFVELGSIDEYLKFRHDRLIREATACMEAGKLWYEQKITPEVLEFIRANQEIQAGVREGNRIFVTKIPFDPSGYLQSSDPAERRYLSCHCPFVRASIKEVGSTIPGLWCYCTGGFEKMVFDTLYEQELEVELVESVLDGGNCCRFAITIPR